MSHPNERPMLPAETKSLAGAAGRTMRETPDRPDTCLDVIRNRLTNLNERAGNHENRLLAMCCRLLGEQPPSNAENVKVQPDLDSLISRISMELDRLEFLAEGNTALIARLEEL